MNTLDETYRYEAFISYNHRDRKFAKYLHTKLENYSIQTSDLNTLRKATPKKSIKPLRPIFLDQTELRAGATLSDAIQQAIRSSKCLIVICSENSIASPWVKAEIELMKTAHDDPVIIGVIPDKYGNETHIDEMFGVGSEHLGADFRSGQNKHLQLSKIAATMSDVDLDTLYKRQTRRQNRQMIGLGTGLTVIALAMSGLAANAHFAEKEAVRQRQHSEEVIAFMIDEFRDDIESLDRLDMLDDIGQKAQTYFEDRDLNSLSDKSILLQSRTLRQLSDVDEKRGNLTFARNRIIGAYKASDYLVTKNSRNMDAILEHAENTDYWVYLAYQNGDLVKAESLAQEALDLYETALGHFPTDEELLWKRSVAEQNIGVMRLQSGQANEAKPYFERTLTAIKKISAERELTEDELYEYANLYTWYIRALPDTTPLSLLYNTRQEQVSLFKIMHENGARSILNQSETLNVERAIVGLLLDTGKEVEAERLMLSNQNGYEKLLEHDPENIGWRRHLMRSKIALAKLRHKQGDIQGRNHLLEDVIQIQTKPNGDLWLVTTDIVLGMNLLKARRFYDFGSENKAFAVLTQGEKDIRDYRKDKIRPRDRYNIASLQDLRAELLLKEGRDSEAKDASRAVLDLLSGKNTYSISEQKMQLAAYNRLGEIDLSHALRAKLEARGIVLGPT